MTLALAEKYCSRCSSTKSVDQFARRAAASDGLQSWCKSCNSEVKGEWIKDNRDKTAANRLWSRHRLRPEALVALLVNQDGRCRLCSVKIDINTLHIDHAHSCCGRIKSCANCRRGLLCQHCNHMVGWYEVIKSTPGGLEVIEVYLSGDAGGGGSIVSNPEGWESVEGGVIWEPTR